MDSTPTPYNSIYSMMMPKTEDGGGKKGPCCLHGKDCRKTEDEESSPYVNLVPTKSRKGPESVPMDEMSERKQKNLRCVVRAMRTLQLGEESPKHKTTHEEGRQKQRPAVDMDETDDSSRMSKRSRKKAKKNRRKKEKPFDTLDNLAAAVKDKRAKSGYLGVKTWEEAQEMVNEKADFRLYHRMGKTTLNELEPALPLFLVYKTASAKYKHYRVKSHVSDGVMTYTVEYGDMNSTVHRSLEHLVRFYRTNVVPHEKNGEQQYDAFPIWSDSN